MALTYTWSDDKRTTSTLPSLFSLDTDTELGLRARGVLDSELNPMQSARSRTGVTFLVETGSSSPMRLNSFRPCLTPFGT